MTRFYIFESPKFERKRSSPIPAGTVAAERLQAQGWKIVETISDETFADTEPAAQHPPEVEAPHSVLEFDVLTEEQARALWEAGYGDENALRAASDDELRAVEGVGPAAVRNIRKALASAQ